METILDGICPEGFILDGLDDWPRSASRMEWSRITRELVLAPLPSWALPVLMSFTAWSMNGRQFFRKVLALHFCDCFTRDPSIASAICAQVLAFSSPWRSLVWKSISLSQYEKYNPDAASADSPAELAQRSRDNMRVFAKTIGRYCTVWADYPEEWKAVCDEVEAGEKEEAA